MNAEAIRSRIRELAAENALRPPASGPPHPALRLEGDLGYDSLAKIELLVALEAAFGLSQVNEEDIAVDTVGDVERLVLRQLKARSS
jgi:acyl carrier protein